MQCTAVHHAIAQKACHDAAAALRAKKSGKMTGNLYIEKSGRGVPSNPVSGGGRNMYTIKFVEGEKIYLRPYAESDLDLVHCGKNDPLVRETLFLAFPQTLDQVRAEMNSWSTARETVLFTICSRAGDKPVGQTAFVRIDHVSRAAVFYLALYDTGEWSRGYGGEATRMMLDYGFNILNLNRIQLHVSCENEHAVSAYKKAGYSIEGTLRQAMYHHDRYVDFYVMGILREEYYRRQ